MLSEALREQIQAIGQRDIHLGRVLEAIVSHIDQQDATARKTEAPIQEKKERKHGN